jgi:hypothetical protein
MSGVAVAADTIQWFLTAGVGSLDLRGDFGVALHAGSVGDVVIPFGDLDPVREAARGESPGMEVAVDRLSRVFPDESGRSMAVVAYRRGAVRALHPSLILFLHDMTVGAGRWVISQVGSALCIAEGKDADADGQSGQDGGQQGDDGAFFPKHW